MINLNELGKSAKTAGRFLSKCSATEKNYALKTIADEILRNKLGIIEANETDRDNAKALGVPPPLIDRLMLNDMRIENIAKAVLKVADLDDPIGEIIDGQLRPNGLKISKIRVPIGVIGIIYESRPNVTVDAASLCLKSGNAVILRGGKEAYNTNVALVEIMQNALVMAGFDRNCISLIEDTSRETALEFMKLNDYLDLLIPRGGAGLIKSVINNATVPVIETGVGNCHVFIDETADIDMACSIIENAKVQRPSVCNAAETMLVHSSIVKNFLPVCNERLSEMGVRIRGCEETMKILGGKITAATDEDYYAEFLDLILAVKIVDSIDEAIAHITKYGTRHSEAIVTESYENSQKFVDEVDAAAVYVNASTRFTDGEEFGFGAEIGISTQKLHARGPMGLKELTTTKYIILGNGQIR